MTPVVHHLRMTMLTYTQRRHAFEAARTYSIENGALVCREDGRPPRALPLREVTRVQLAYEPTRVQTGLWTCRVWGGSFWGVLSSAHYRGIYDSEDRSEAYASFVRTLNDGVTAASPNAVFMAGPGWPAFLFNGIALLLGLLLFGGVLVLVGLDEVSEWAWMRMLLILPFVALCWPWFKRNWPRRFDPKSPPSGLLP